MHPIIIMLQVTMTSCHQIVLYNIKNILCVKVRGKKEEEQHTIILNNGGNTPSKDIWIRYEDVNRNICMHNIVEKHFSINIAPV
jgi:hypothetical protein